MAEIPLGLLGFAAGAMQAAWLCLRSGLAQPNSPRLLSVKRLCERVRSGHAARYSFLDGASIYPNALAPFSHAQSFAVQRYVMVSPRVSILFLRSGPFAVVRAVRAVIIAAINRMIRRRPLAHIGIKIREIVPSVADYNAAPAVIGVAGGVRVVATPPHIFPYPVLRTLIRLAMSTERSHAAAAMGFSRYKRRAADVSLSAARTSAKVIGVFCSHERELQNCPKPVLPANNLFDVARACSKIDFSHHAWSFQEAWWQGAARVSNHLGSLAIVIRTALKGQPLPNAFGPLIGSQAL